MYPFVVTQENGGPYEAAAFVAGAEYGYLDALMEVGRPSIERYVAPELVKQLDLAAMHRGYVLTSEPWDEHPDEWTLVTLVRRPAEDPS